MESVGLIVGGRTWRYWKNASIRMSILDAARSFDLGLHRRTDRSAPDITEIQRGSSCVVLAGEDRVVTGIIDRIRINETATALDLSVGGRSKTAKLVKCSPLSGKRELHGLNPIQAANHLARQYNIGVIATVEPGKAFGIHSMQVGESSFETIERFSRERGWLVTDDGHGYLRLCVAGSDRGDDLVYGTSHVLDWTFESDSSERFTEYVCLGQKAGSDSQYGADVANCKATFYDDGWIDDRLVKVIRMEGAADLASCKRRAQWEALRRAGKSVVLTVRLPRWRMSDGRLWEPNMLSRVVYPRAGIDMDLLVVEVHFEIGIQGEFAELTLGQPGGYDPKPPKAPKKRKT